MGQRPETQSRKMVDEAVNIEPILNSQNEIWGHLSQIVFSNKIGSAYLFSGPAGSGKEAISIKFSQLINCRMRKSNYCNQCSSCIKAGKLYHEKIKLIFPLPRYGININKGLMETNEKTIEQLNNSINRKSKNLFYKIRLDNANRILLESIRELRKTLYLKNNGFGRMMVIIFDAHLLCSGQGESANAFLKLLEEPPDKTTFIIVSDYVELLFHTIVSRCQKINFPRLKDSYIDFCFKSKIVNQNERNLLVGLSKGNMRNAQFYSEHSLDNIQRLITELVEQTTQENVDLWRRFTNEYSRYAKQNSEKFESHIMLLKIWFQSVNRLKNKINDHLHHTHLKVHMEKFLMNYPNADLQSIVVELEELMRSTSVSLYMNLVLTNFLLKVQKLLKV